MAYSNAFLGLYGLQIVILEDASFVSYQEDERTKLTHILTVHIWLKTTNYKKGSRVVQKNTASRIGASKNMLVLHGITCQETEVSRS